MSPSQSLFGRWRSIRQQGRGHTFKVAGLVTLFIMLCNIIFAPFSHDTWVDRGRTWDGWIRHVTRPAWEKAPVWREVKFREIVGKFYPEVMQHVDREDMQHRAGLSDDRVFPVKNVNAEIEGDTKQQQQQIEDDPKVLRKQKILDSAGTTTTHVLNRELDADREERKWSPVFNVGMQKVCFDFIHNIVFQASTIVGKGEEYANHKTPKMGGVFASTSVVEKRYLYSSGRNTEARGAKTDSSEALSRRRLLVDAIQWNGEWALLLLRFQEMLPIVDRMYLFETELGYSGKVKSPQWWAPGGVKEIAAFAEWHGIDPRMVLAKVVHVKLGKERFKFALDKLKEDPHKNFFKLEGQVMGQMAVYFALHKVHWLPQDGKTVLLQLHADEIVRGDVLQALKWCPIKPHYFPMNLQMKNFLYSYEFERVDTWEHPKVLLYSGVGCLRGRMPDKPTASRLLITDAGWHCSWCLSTVDSVLQKVEHYVHQDAFYRVFLNGKTSGQPDRKLAREKIQDYMCSGEHVSTDYPDMFSFWGAWTTTSIQGRVVVQTAGSFDAPTLLLDVEHRMKSTSSRNPTTSGGDQTTGMQLTDEEEEMQKKLKAVHSRQESLLKFLIPGQCRRDDWQ